MTRQTIQQEPRTPQATWPRSGTGRAALVVAALEAACIGLILFVLPMIGEVLDTEVVPGILNTWVTPLALVVVTGLVAVLSLVAWWRGDRSLLGQVVLILTLAGGAFLAVDLVLEALAGR